MDPRWTVTVITGANSGIGLDAAHRLALLGGTVVILCRSEERGLPARDAIRAASGNPDVHLVTADLASFSQVRKAGAQIRDTWPRITALVNNAGLASLGRQITGDGFELTLQVNHLSHFLLTALLLEPLRSGRARVVNVSSGAHRRGRLGRAPLADVLRGDVEHHGLLAYCDSKQANILFTQELARREAATGITVNALHPGMLSTSIWDRNAGWKYWVAQALKPFMQKPEVGGRALARLVSDPELSTTTGAYFYRMEAARPHGAARDEALARELWYASEAAVASL